MFVAILARNKLNRAIKHKLFPTSQENSVGGSPDFLFGDVLQTSRTKHFMPYV